MFKVNLDDPDIGNRKWYETDIEMESIGLCTTCFRIQGASEVKCALLNFVSFNWVKITFWTIFRLTFEKLWKIRY